MEKVLFENQINTNWTLFISTYLIVFFYLCLHNSIDIMWTRNINRKKKEPEFER